MREAYNAQSILIRSIVYFLENFVRFNSKFSFVIYTILIFVQLPPRVGLKKRYLLFIVSIIIISYHSVLQVLPLNMETESNATVLGAKLLNGNHK